MCVCKYIFRRVNSWTNTYISKRMKYTYINIYIYICIYIHIHIYIYIRKYIHRYQHSDENCVSTTVPESEAYHSQPIQQAKYRFTELTKRNGVFSPEDGSNRKHAVNSRW